MKKTVFALAVLSFMISSCGSSDKKSVTEKEKEKANYEKTKEDLGAKEKKSPEDFITVNAHDKHNLIGQTVIKGSVTSKATVAVYKDIELELAFYSKTGALLEKDKETVYETLKPGSSEDFKTKYFAPKGTDSIAVKVLGAKPGE